MLAKRWIGAALSLAVVLVVAWWVARESPASEAAQRSSASSAASPESPALDAAQVGARAVVEPAARRDAKQAGGAREAQTSPPRARVPFTTLRGVVRGIAPRIHGSAVVVCECDYGGQRFTRSSEISSDGAFEIESLPTSGLYLLRARLGEHGAELARSGRIEFDASERERYVELTVGSHPTRLVVRIRDEAGAPVTGARVRLDADDEHGAAPGCLVDSVHVARSDDAGEIVLAPIDPTSWLIGVEHEEHAPATARCHARAGETTLVEVVSRRGLGLRGRLLTTRGDPASGESLAFTFADPQSGALTWLLADVDDHGRFVLRNAPDAELTPQVERYKDRNTPRLTFGWNALAPVRPGRGDVDLVVPELCRLIGRCVSRSRPPELYVSARVDDEYAQLRVRLGPSGEFAIPLEPRSGRLCLSIEPYNSAAESHSRGGVVLTTNFPAAGSVLDLGAVDFAIEPVLKGIVRSSDGAAARGMRVELLFDGPHWAPPRQARSDIDGQFHFQTAPDLPGVLRVRHGHEEQAELRLDNVAAAARAGELVLVLQPAARVVGRLHWNRAAHRGLPQIALIGRHEDGHRVVEERVVASESGEFELTAWPGSYELWLQWLGDDTWIEGPRVTLEFGRVTPLEWTVD